MVDVNEKNECLYRSERGERSSPCNGARTNSAINNYQAPDYVRAHEGVAWDIEWNSRSGPPESPRTRYPWPSTKCDASSWRHIYINKVKFTMETICPAHFNQGQRERKIILADWPCPVRTSTRTYLF